MKVSLGGSGHFVCRFFEIQQILLNWLIAKEFKVGGIFSGAIPILGG